MPSAVNGAMNHHLLWCRLEARCYGPCQGIGTARHRKTYATIDYLPVNSEFTPYAVHVSTILMFNTKYFVDIGTIFIQRVDSEFLQNFWFGFNVRDSKKFHSSPTCQATGLYPLPARLQPERLGNHTLNSIRTAQPSMDFTSLVLVGICSVSF